MVKGSKTITNKEDGSISVLFDLRLYSIDSVKKASYKFASDFSVLLSQPSGNELEAQISFSGTLDEQGRKALVGSFCNEVIDQDLRERIFKETEATRNLILAQAFSRTNLLSEE